MSSSAPFVGSLWSSLEVSCDVLAVAPAGAGAGLDGRRAVLKTSRMSCCKGIGILALKSSVDLVDWGFGLSLLGFRAGCFGGWRVRCDWDWDWDFAFEPFRRSDCPGGMFYFQVQGLYI